MTLSPDHPMIKAQALIAEAIAVEPDQLAEATAIAAVKVIAELAEVLDYAPTPELSTSVPMLAELTEALSTLKAVESVLNLDVAEQVDAQDREMVIIPGEDGGFVVNTKRNRVIKRIDKDAIMRQVERLSAEPVHRLIPDTGELMDQNAAKVELFKKMFRMEPRWTELRKVGIDADEYATVGWSTKAIIQEAGI